MALNESESRRELQEAAAELRAVRSRLRVLRARVMRTKGFQRSLKVLRASGPDKTLPPVSLAFKWAGYLDGALTAVDGAIRDLRMGARLRRRGLRRGR